MEMKTGRDRPRLYRFLCRFFFSFQLSFVLDGTGIEEIG